jgi:hypothetical protein
MAPPDIFNCRNCVLKLRTKLQLVSVLREFHKFVYNTRILHILFGKK